MSAYSGFTDEFFAAESAMRDRALSLLFSPVPSPPPPTEAGEPVEAVEAGVNDLAAQISPFSAPSPAGSVESDSAMSSLFSPPPSPSPVVDETTTITNGDENDFGDDYSDDSALSPLFSGPPSPSPVSETINTAVGDENHVGDDYNDDSALSPLFSPPPSPSPVEATSARSRSPSLPPIAPIAIPTTKPASEKVYLGLRLPGIRGPTVPAQIGSTQLEKPSEKVHLGLRMPGIRTPAPVGIANAQPAEKTSDKPKPKARSSAHATTTNIFKATGGQDRGMEKKSHAKGCKRKSNSCDYCKRRQIKCDRDEFNACTACLKKGIECVYNIVPGKRGALKASQEGVAMGRTVSGSLINGGLPCTPRLSSSPSSSASINVHTPPRSSPAKSTVVVPASLYAQLASTSSANYNIVAEPSAPTASSGASAPTQLPASAAAGAEINVEGQFDFDEFYRDIGLVAPAPEAAPIAPLPAADAQGAAVSQQQWTLAQWCRDNGIDEADFLTNPVFQIPGLAAPAPGIAPMETKEEKDVREAAEMAAIVAFFSTPEMRSFNDVGC